MQLKNEKKPCLFVRLRKVRIFVCPPSDILLLIICHPPDALRVGVFLFAYAEHRNICAFSS